MPAIVKLSVEELAEAVSSMDLEEMRQLQEIIGQKLREKEISHEKLPKKWD